MIFHFILGLLLMVQGSQQPEDLNLNHKGETITIVNRKDFQMPVQDLPILDVIKFNQLSNQVDKQIYQEPKNAFIDGSGILKAEKVGFKLNRTAFAHQFYTYFYSRNSAHIQIPIQYIYPRVDSELLDQIRAQKIGEYVTYFNSYNKDRTHNISLASKALDNHVVFPGETFSFNKVVGRRTEAKGYMRAPIIVRGELSEGIGGGICQVSSTLFNAVDRAGVKIVQRYSHSKRVPYVPPGRDATVSWYGPDFTFKNNYNQPLLIRSHVYGGTMVVKIFSSEAISYEPRQVPKTIKTLPEETSIDSTVNN